MLPEMGEDVTSVARRCYEASRRVTIASYDVLQSDLVVMRYFDGLYGFLSNRVAVAGE